MQEWVKMNEPDAHFNTQTSHNMNLRKQMAFRPFLQNGSQMHEMRGTEMKWECVQVILKEKTRNAVSCYTWVSILLFQGTCRIHKVI